MAQAPAPPIPAAAIRSRRRSFAAWRTRIRGFWIAKPADGARWPIPARWIDRTPRIGVDYAGAWAAKPLRFVVDAGRLPRMVRAGFDPVLSARPTQPVRRR